MKINIVGNVFGQSGYSIHTKNLALALNKLCDVSVECQLFQNWEQQCSDDMVDMIRKRKDDSDWHIVINHPQYAKQIFAERKNVIPFVVFEGDRIPKWWKEILSYNDFKFIFCPSQHTKDAMIKAVDIGQFKGVVPYEQKIKIIPHGFDEKVFRPVEPMQDLKDDRFTFLYVGGWAQGENDRKNLVFLLKAFSEEFKKDEKVKLIVKINGCYNIPGFNLKEEFDKLNLNPDRPPIVLTVENMNEQALAKLYCAADFFVCPTRAEAFGMSFLESLACGVPVIAGGYGGQTDFINDSNGVLLPIKELSYSKDRDMCYEGIKWAEYDQKELQAIMRKAFNKELKFGDVSKTIQDWKWSDTAKKVLECLK